MKRLLQGIASILILASMAYAGEYYRLDGVTRVEQDLYKTTSGFWVVTRYCYHYGYSETAILKWDGPYGTNKITWNGDSCDVKSIIRK